MRQATGAGAAMVKVVLNKCFGGFSFSEAAEKRLAELKGVEEPVYARGVSRHDPDLVQVVEEMGDAADGDFASLAIVETDSDRYRIHNYDGMESLETPETIDWVEV